MPTAGARLAGDRARLARAGSSSERSPVWGPSQVNDDRTGLTTVYAISVEMIADPGSQAWIMRDKKSGPMYYYYRG